MAHRIVFLWMTGNWPRGKTDHINGARSDNRWANLRETTPFQSNGNTRLRADSRSGFKGVALDKGGKYRAQIRINGKQVHLGTFSSPVKAAIWYHAFAQLAFGEYAKRC
jgi:hypothetical protein